MVAINPLEEMIPSNKKRRAWNVLNQEGERAVVGSMYESSLRVVFTERLYESMIPQGISDIGDIKTNGEVGAVGSRDMIFKGERDLHSAAGEGLR